MRKSASALAELAVSLFDRVDLGFSQLFRLAGIGLGNFQIEAELPLLASSRATKSIVEEFTGRSGVDGPSFNDILLE
jgi:hypothetical protein